MQHDAETDGGAGGARVSAYAGCAFTEQEAERLIILSVNELRAVVIDRDRLLSNRAQYERTLMSFGDKEDLWCSINKFAAAEARAIIHFLDTADERIEGLKADVEFLRSFVSSNQ